MAEVFREHPGDQEDFTLAEGMSCSEDADPQGASSLLTLCSLFLLQE